MTYINSYNGMRRYGSERVSVSKKWTDMDAPSSAQERREEELWMMSEEDYEKFLEERKEMYKRRA